jgi:deazaflavin-dependent oxidoreductase (nitroreductase family)
MKMAWYMKPGNKVIVALSRLGLSFGDRGPVVLTVTGRKSGAARSTPVTPMSVDGKRYVAGVPGADWIANARTAGEATLQRGRRTERVRVVELAEQEARPLLRQLPELVPGWVGFLRKGGLVTDGTPDEFEALVGAMPIFRLDPLH